MTLPSDQVWELCARGLDLYAVVSWAREARAAPRQSHSMSA